MMNTLLTNDIVLLFKKLFSLSYKRNITKYVYLNKIDKIAYTYIFKFLCIYFNKILDAAETIPKIRKQVIFLYNTQ